MHLQRLVANVAEATPQSAVVDIAGDPAADYEPMLSMVDQIAHAGRQDLHLEALLLPPPDPYTAREAALAQAFQSSSLGQSTQRTSCTGLSAVVVVRDEAATRQALPCLADFERVDLTSSVLLWGGDQVSLRPRLPGFARAGYILFVQRRAQ